jgi:hypothetical protein
MRTRYYVALISTAALPAALLATVSRGAPAVGADHLDAPGLSSPAARADADITDIYAFRGADAARTALVLNTGPASGAADYGADVAYAMNIDRNGDARADLAYVWRYSPGNGTGTGQHWTLTRYTGSNATTWMHGVTLGSGQTGSSTAIKGDGVVFTGLRSDPFFFDLTAFLNDVLGVQTNRHLCDANTNDFFAPLNVHAIVLEVPNDELGAHIGYWATTSVGSTRIDRMGRPAINTVFNKGNDKNRFNAGDPVNDYAGFAANVEGVLEHFSGLDAEGPYTAAQAETLAHVLLPDVLTYAPGSVAAGPLNGRGLADDVIDAELNIVTGGFPFAGRDATGAVTGDCVGAHTDLTAAFPYLGNPHS